MQKVLLLGINARYTHSNLAIRYIRNNIKHLPVETTLREVTINQSISEILEIIWQDMPDILAISVYIWNSELVKKIILDIKKILPELKLVLGGPEVSYNPHKWLNEFSQIDNIICGNGESGFEYFLKNQETEKIISQPRKPFADVKFPYIAADFPDIIGKYIYYESSRGCPFKCSYCLSSRSDQKLEFKPVKQVLEELDFLIAQKPKIIKFVDRTFNAKVNHYQAIWKYLISKAPTTKFHCEIHPELLSEDDFEILSKAPKDLFQFEIGIQSTNQSTIAAINRKDNWQKSRKNILRLIALNKFHVHTDLIVGLPFENLESLAKSFDDIHSLGAEHFQLGFLKVLPGTQMHSQADEFGLVYSDNQPYEILANNWLSFEEILQLKEIEKLIDKYVNSEKFTNTLRLCNQLFGSPFAFYSNFAKYCQSQQVDSSIKNWWKNAATLMDFMNEYFPAENKLIKDFLRFDWSHIFPGNFPIILQDEFCQNLQSKCFEYLKSFNESGIIKYKKYKFNTKNIKNANYFLAETEKFYQLLKLEKQVLMFIDKKQIALNDAELLAKLLN